MIKFTNHQSNILNLCDKKTTTKKHKNTNVHYNFFMSTQECIPLNKHFAIFQNSKPEFFVVLHLYKNKYNIKN